MKKLSIILMTGVIISNPLFSQLRTSIGYNIGLSYQFYHLTDYGNQLQRHPIVIGQKGFSLIQDINHHVSIEAGLFSNEYYQSINMADKNIILVGELSSLQIPLRFRYRFSFVNDRIGISPIASISLGVNRIKRNIRYQNSNNITEDTYYFPNTKDSVYQKADVYTNVKGMFLSAGSGLSIDYRFRNGIQIALTGIYNAGLSRMLKANIDYSVNGAPLSHAVTYSNGNNFQVWLSLHYPVSNFWQKSWKESEYSKILQSRLYIKTEVGLVNNFFHSNGDLDPTIRNGFSIRDCDHAVSLLAGYMLTKHIAVESGLTSMNYTNLYSIKQNGTESGSGFSRGGSGFYMIPATIRYYHFFKGGRMALVPEAGFCLLLSKPDIGVYDSTLLNYGSLNGDTTIMTASHATTYREHKTVVLFKAGISYEYALAPRIILTLSARYHFGFSDINRLEVEENNKTDIKKGNVYYNGSNLTFSCGIRVPIGAEM
jgi:hypothetical protein